MSELNGKNRHDYSKYDEMSTEALEQILRLDFQASGDSESDIDAILYISEVIAKRKGSSAEGDVDAAWKQLKTKYLPYADGRSLYDFDDEDSVVSKPTEPQPNHSKKVRNHSRRHRPHHLLRLRRLLTVAVIVVACLFGGIMVAQAAGIDVLGAIGRWTDETFRFVLPGSNESSAREIGTEYYEEIETTLTEWGAKEELFPTWQPEGFVAQEPRTAHLNNSDTISMSYEGNNRFYLVSISRFLTPTDVSGDFEKDSDPVEEYPHKDNVFYIFSNIDTITATCYDGAFMTTIGGTLTMAEIKTIIDSIGGE